MFNFVGYVRSNFTDSYSKVFGCGLADAHFNIYLTITYLPLVSDYTFLER